MASAIRILSSLRQFLGRGHHWAPPREEEHASNPSPGPPALGSIVTGQSIKELLVCVRQLGLLRTDTNEILNQAPNAD
jgi:hypothetical protein